MFVPHGQSHMDDALGCPVFSRMLLQDDPEGNMCLLEQLLPCKLAAVPYPNLNRSQVVIVGRFANFMQSLPTVAEPRHASEDEESEESDVSDELDMDEADEVLDALQGRLTSNE